MHYYQIPAYFCAVPNSNWPIDNATHLLKDQMSHSPSHVQSKKSYHSKKSSHSKKSHHSQTTHNHSQSHSQSHSVVSHSFSQTEIHTSSDNLVSLFRNFTLATNSQLYETPSEDYVSYNSSFSSFTFEPTTSSSYVPPNEDYVVDLMNLERKITPHLKKRKWIEEDVLTERNALIVFQEIHDCLVKLVPRNGFVHLVIKPFHLWNVVLSAFRQIFYGNSTLTFCLYHVTESDINPRFFDSEPDDKITNTRFFDSECDDRYALRLCKDLSANFNTNVTLLSNDKYANFHQHQHLPSDATQYFWNEDGVPSYQPYNLSNDLDYTKDLHRIFYFDVKMNGLCQSVIEEVRDT
jgi:hypothetical protein